MSMKGETKANKDIKISDLLPTVSPLSVASANCLCRSFYGCFKAV